MNNEEFEELLTSFEESITNLEYKESLNRIEGLLGDIRGLLKILTTISLAVFFYNFFKIMSFCFSG